MSYTSILDNCVHSIGGVKDFNISTRDENDDPLSFPLDFIIKTGDTNTLLVSNDFDDRLFSINTTVLKYRHVIPNYVTYEENEIEDRRGRYYQKTLTFSMPKINLTTQNQLKEFLFLSDGEFSISNAVVWFTDSNNHKWIAGYDIPFQLIEFDLETGDRQGDNNYRLIYQSNSYFKTKNWELI